MGIAGTDQADAGQVDGAPWRVLGVLCLGFFMIMVDSTIVSVATPVIMRSLHANIDQAVWVTSSFLLAYAVPLLFTGRLGDQIGPRTLYLTGLVVFTVASAACGFSRTIAVLIAARAVQGFGAALLTPQTMSVIQRIFPAERRGAAMSVWGSVAGIALLVGPVLGGTLTDSFGWSWIFFVNVPIGVVAFLLAWIFVPVLPTTRHRFDLRGIVLSGAGVFALTFGIQQGQSTHWDSRTWILIAFGAAFVAAFIWWQSRNKDEPLLPIAIFSDRNFSLANIAIGAVGFAVTGMALPLMLYAQNVEHLDPTRAAFLLVPMAVIAAALAPVVGRIVDRSHPRYVAGFGLTVFALALGWLALVIRPGLAIWELIPPISLMGVGNAFVWSPISATATRTLSPEKAGAASGIYNTSRQLGGVLGSAAVGALMQSRLTTNLAGVSGPVAEQARYALSMAQTLVQPGALLLVGVLAVSFFVKQAAHSPGTQRSVSRPELLSSSEAR